MVSNSAARVPIRWRFKKTHMISQYRRRYSQLRLHRDLLESFEALMHFCSGKTAIIYSYTVYVLDAHLCFQNIQENEHYYQY